jgi:type IV secretion system protein TrbG
MKKTLFAVVTTALIGTLPALAMAAPGDDPANLYFSNNNPTLTRQEKAAMSMASKWKAEGATGTAMSPGPNGSVKFLYGAQQPSIVCAVLQVCDVSLQAGEQVNSINLGDTARWAVEPAVTGSGGNEVQHLIIKPLDVGLETSMVVTTNRRTYHLRLRSHRKQYMPQVAFIYPEEAAAKWEAIKGREVKDRRDKTLPETGEYLGNLSFDYTLTGNAAWKPVRVYNDGRKTIIQMPQAMAQTEAPTLLVVRKDGGLLTDAETVMVNYRIQSNRYIVDTIFDKAILIAGVGANQDRITIQRTPRGQ